MNKFEEIFPFLLNITTNTEYYNKYFQYLIHFYLLHVFLLSWIFHKCDLMMSWCFQKIASR